MKIRNALPVYGALFITLLSLALTLMAGCGSGGGTMTAVSNTGSTTRHAGSAAFTIHWPARPADKAATRVFPEAANSLKVQILRDGTLLATQSAIRTSSGATVTLKFTSLPYANLTAVATAYASTDLSGPALAIGAVSLPIGNDDTVAVSLSMTSTIDHLTLTPAAFPLGIGQTETLTATAYDGPDEATASVILLSPDKLAWTKGGAAADVSSDGKVTALAVGTTPIYVTDIESGKMATAVVTVTLTPTPLPTPTPTSTPPPTAGPFKTISFLPAVTYKVESPNALVVGDLDKDGNTDIIVNGGPGNNVYVFYGRGDATFESGVAVESRNANNLFPKAIADMNGDGLLDILCTSSSSINVHVLQCTGGRAFTDTLIHIGDDTASLTAGDFNGDGKTDLAVTVPGDGPGGYVLVLKNLGGNNYAQTASFGIPGYAMDLTSGDINGDGKIDLIATFGTSTVGQSGLNLYLGKGDGTFDGGIRSNTGTQGVRTPMIADLNNDGKLDVAVGDYWDNNVALLFNNGSGNLALSDRYPCGAYPNSAVAVDLDGDGWKDIATTNAGNNAFTVLQNKRNSTLGPQQEFPTGGSGSGGMGTGDFNKDGKPDLVVANGGSGTIGVLINNTP